MGTNAHDLTSNLTRVSVLLVRCCFQKISSGVIVQILYPIAKRNT